MEYCPTLISVPARPPDVLRRMARPRGARTLDEIAAWRADCPDLTLRSTFIVGYPGETEEEFQHLYWLDERNGSRRLLQIRKRGRRAVTPYPITWRMK